MQAWYVVYTQINAEAKAVAHLNRQGFETYLPLYPKKRRHARRTETVMRPLFPRYLFTWLDPESQQWRPILSTIGVSTLLRQGERPAPVPAGFVDELAAREKAGLFEPLTPASRFRPNDSVRITTGPFSDLIGRFYQMADAERVYVLLDMMGREIKTRVSAEALELA